MQTSRNIRTIPALDGSSDYVVFRRGPAGVAIQAEAREDEQETLTVGPFDLDELRTVLDHLAATPEEPLGAYQRHEKHDADDFAKDEFARHPDGRIAARLDDDSFPWIATSDCYRDEDMAGNGWSSVRECPDPEVHALSGASLAAHFRDKRDMERARAEKAEKERDEVAEDRDRVFDLVRDADMHRDLANERAERAERERDEAREDRNDALRREKAEQDRANKARRERDAAVDSALFSAESRPLTPDAISADAYERGVPVLRSAPQKPSVMVAHETVRAIVAAVLTEPPARPEGAEELGELIGTWTATEGIAPAQLPTGSLATLADFLAERGVRVVGEEDPR